MRHDRRALLVLFFAAAAALAVDQLTKYLITRSIPVDEPIPDHVFIAFGHVSNTGIIFGIDAPLWFAIAMPLVLVIGVLAAYFWRGPFKGRATNLAVGLFVGGTLGNWIDRVRFGWVTDFVDVRIVRRCQVVHLQPGGRLHPGGDHHMHRGHLQAVAGEGRQEPVMDAARRLSLTADTSGVRLDLYICQSSAGLSRSLVQKLIEDGHVSVNGEPAKPSRKVRTGDVIVVEVPPPEPSPELVPEAVPLAILYEDQDILVVNKPAGLTVYPAPGHPRHTLMNAVLAHCPEISGIENSVRPGVVHRLDKDTSGAMVVARNKSAQLHLVSQFKGRRMLKKYLVLVQGRPSPEEGAIEGSDRPASEGPQEDGGD